MLILLIIFIILICTILYIKRNSIRLLLKDDKNIEFNPEDYKNFDPIPTESKYKKRKDFLSLSESTFYKTLKEIIKDQYLIQCKVRLEDLIEPDYKPFTKEYTKARNPIKGMHVDFVLCNPDDLKISCAIELNDNSHNTEKRKHQDEIKSKALQTAGIPLFTIENDLKENKEFILNKIFTSK